MSLFLVFCAGVASILAIQTAALRKWHLAALALILFGMSLAGGILLEGVETYVHCAGLLE